MHTLTNSYGRFSKPFTGYIYPYGFFDKCILYVGKGELDVKLTLSQDICKQGLPPPPVPGYSQRVDPFMEVTDCKVNTKPTANKLIFFHSTD